MCKVAKAFSFICLLAMFALPVDSIAGVYVYLRLGPPPVRVVTVVRPARPYPHSIWVAGHWKYDCGRYVWVEGRWINGRRHYAYVQPHWVRTTSGSYFVPGHWVRK